FAGRAGDWGRAGGVGRRQIGAGAGPGRLTDQVVLAGLQHAGEVGLLPGVAAGARVLERPAVQDDRHGASVEELDEVVAVGGPGVAATAVDLADDDVWRST